MRFLFKIHIIIKLKQPWSTRGRCVIKLHNQAIQSKSLSILALAKWSATMLLFRKQYNQRGAYQYLRSVVLYFFMFFDHTNKAFIIPSSFMAWLTVIVLWPCLKKIINLNFVSPLTHLNMCWQSYGTKHYKDRRMGWKNWGILNTRN